MLHMANFLRPHYQPTANYLNLNTTLYWNYAILLATSACCLSAVDSRIAFQIFVTCLQCTHLHVIQKTEIYDILKIQKI